MLVIGSIILSLNPFSLNYFFTNPCYIKGVVKIFSNYLYNYESELRLTETFKKIEIMV